MRDDVQTTLDRLLNAPTFTLGQTSVTIVTLGVFALPWRVPDRDPRVLLTGFADSAVTFEIQVWTQIRGARAVPHPISTRRSGMVFRAPAWRSPSRSSMCTCSHRRRSGSRSSSGRVVRVMIAEIRHIRLHLTPVVQLRTDIRRYMVRLKGLPDAQEIGGGSNASGERSAVQ